MKRISGRLAPVDGPEATPDESELESLLDAWRRTREETAAAYAAWSSGPATGCAMRYAVYVAAADREEAGERVVLAALTRAAPPPREAARTGRGETRPWDPSAS